MRQAIGRLERVTPRRITGWAAYTDGTAAAEVTLAVNGDTIAVVVADLLRADLRSQQLHPTGRCGFSLTLPGDLRLVDGDVVSARVAGVDGELENSPTICSAPKRGGRKAAAAAERSKPQDRPAPAAAASDVPMPPRIPPVLGRSSWRIFLDSLHAFFLRELRSRYGTHRLGYVMAVAQPMLFMIGMRYVRRLLSNSSSDDVHGVNVMFYLMIAMIPYFMFRQAFSRAMGATRDFRALFNYPQVRPIDALIVRVSIEFLIMICAFVLLYIGLVWFGSETEADAPVMYAFIVFLLYIFSLGLGLIVDVYVSINKELAKVFKMIERPFFFISGVFFTMEDVPGAVLPYLYWNPLLHAIDLARGAMLSDYTSPGSLLYFFLFSIILLFIGLALYKKRLREMLGAAVE